MPTRDKTTQEIADALDIDPSTVLNYAKQGLPHDPPAKKKESSKFDLAEVVAWMKANNRTGQMGRPQESNDELKALKIRKELALVVKYERENAVEDGKLIDASEEQRRDVGKIVAVRNRLCGLGASLAPQLVGHDGATIQTLIDESIENILKEFAKDEKA